MALASKILLLSLVAGSALSLSPHKVIRRDLSFDELSYLSYLCYPNYLNTTIDSSDPADYTIAALLHDSPLPCEQVQYIFNGCIANGTTEIDYLAEQQCLCGSNFIDAFRGCIDCSRAHGYSEGAEQSLTDMDSIWNAECKSGPSPGFVELYQNGFSEPESSTTTLSGDRFPSQTAVSNYWTGAPRAILGSITGSATARATTFSDRFDFTEPSYTTSDVMKTSSKRANFSYTSNSTSTASSTTGSSLSTTLAPSSSTPITPLSQASTSAPSTSTNGVGLEIGIAWNSGVVLVVVNVAVVVFL